LFGILLVNYQDNTQNYHSFLAKTLDDEKQMWQDFINWLEKNPQHPIFHYSEYEAETIKKLAHRYHTPSSQLQSIISRLIDIHHMVIKSVFLPVENYSLKTVGTWLGSSWQNSITQKKSSHSLNIGGDQCIVWYDQWLKTGNNTYLQLILEYNKDDCFATYQLTKWLREFLLQFSD